MLHRSSHARQRAKIVRYHNQESEADEGWSRPELADIKLSIMLKTHLLSLLVYLHIPPKL